MINKEELSISTKDVKKKRQKKTYLMVRLLEIIYTLTQNNPTKNSKQVVFYKMN